MGPIKVLTRAVHKVADLAMFLVVGNDYTYIYNVSWVRSRLPIAHIQAEECHVFSQFSLVAIFFPLSGMKAAAECVEKAAKRTSCVDFPWSSRAGLATAHGGISSRYFLPY